MRAIVLSLIPACDQLPPPDPASLQAGDCRHSPIAAAGDGKKSPHPEHFHLAWGFSVVE
jgi:hypothetical protein